MEEDKVQEQAEKMEGFSYVQELMKDRSYINCISTAYHDVTENFKPLIKETWKYALAYALITGASSALSYATTLQGGLLGILAHVLIYVGWFVCCFVWYGKVFSLLNKQSIRHNSWKMVKGILSVYAILFVILLLFYGLGIFMAMGYKNPSSFSLTVMGMTGIGLILMFVLSVPLGYSVVRYMLEDGSVRHLLGRDWIKGFKHWGFIFATLLIATIISTVVISIVGTPLFILILAGHLSSEGVAMGDPVNLPSTMSFFVWFCTSIVMLCNAYFGLWMSFICYYVYGSIEIRDREKNETENIIY